MHRAKMDSNGTKFIAVTGGVISGLGKGVVTASLGRLLKAHGYSVTAVKIDPYLNFDAGTMRPTEHGEVFVTFDGGETDQDLGNYERFLDEPLSRQHNITSGQVFGQVIENERNMHYKGACVEVIPHIPQEAQRRILEVAQKTKADFVLIEVGGTIGDYQNMLFIEALKRMFFENRPILFVHVVYLPVPTNIGEMKTKPAQHSVRALNELGIFPDFLVCRSQQPIDSIRKQKISLFCNVKPEEIISAHDLKSIYEEPLVFAEQEFGKKILEKLGLPESEPDLAEWKNLVEKSRNAPRETKIGIVGKYFDSGDFTLEDSYISVIESVKFAAWKNSAKPKIEWIDSKQFEKNPESIESLKNYSGIIVPGGFGNSGVEGKILAIQYCRENNIPYLGLCYGLQLAVIEFARNVLGFKRANTTENDPDTPYPVIDVLPEQRQILEKNHYGNTMRLGNYEARLKTGTKVWELYGKTDETILERHRHRYEVNPDFEADLEKAGLVLSGKNPQRNLVEFIELENHPFFVATQAHPEFTSRPLKPNPLFDGFLKAALAKNTQAFP